MPRILDDYLTPAELCEQLGIVPKTLSRWHALGEAPPRTMIGRKPYYKRISIEAWLASREQVSA
jgi:predicted site-specific integrase-resolvase